MKNKGIVSVSVFAMVMMGIGSAQAVPQIASKAYVDNILDALDARVTTNTNDITTLKTTVGDSTSGLVKDVADAASNASTALSTANTASTTATNAANTVATMQTDVDGLKTTVGDSTSGLVKDVADATTAADAATAALASKANTADLGDLAYEDLVTETLIASSAVTSGKIA